MGWGCTRSWEGTWLGQLTPDQRDIPLHMAPCSAVTPGGRLVRIAAQGPAGHQLVVSSWFTFASPVFLEFYFFLFVIFLFITFFFSIIKLFLYQPMSLFTFTLSVLCPHPADAGWASGFAQLPAGVKPQHGNIYFFFSFKITWMPFICNISLCYISKYHQLGQIYSNKCNMTCYYSSPTRKKQLF